MKFLDKIPFRTIIILTIFLGLVPFRPEPHLYQKLNMLVSGELVNAVDVFDLLFHIAPAVVLLAKIYRHKTGADQVEK
ncbi:MAG: RND transporter [Paracoccaceae bacterium]